MTTKEAIEYLKDVLIWISSGISIIFIFLFMLDIIANFFSLWKFLFAILGILFGLPGALKSESKSGSE